MERETLRRRVMHCAPSSHEFIYKDIRNERYIQIIPTTCKRLNHFLLTTAVSINSGYDCKGTTVAISSSSCSKLGRESHGLQSADDDVAPGASIAVIAGKVSFTNH